MTTTITAKFKGICASTGRAINPGDRCTYDYRTGKMRLLDELRSQPETGRYISDVVRIGGKEFYRNKRGRCIDAPCCGCCTI